MPTQERRAKDLGVPVSQLPDGRGKHGNHPKGAGSSRFNGGVTLGSQGYLRVNVGKGHPLADRKGYTSLHLLVWVAAGNEKPPKGFIIHHRNGRKWDNRIENMEQMSNPHHCQTHLHTEEAEWAQEMEDREDFYQEQEGPEHDG